MKNRSKGQLFDKMPKSQGNEALIASLRGTTKCPSFQWCGIDWTTAMENGRQIHEGQSWMWYDGGQVWYDDNELSLHIEKKPTTIHYWNGKIYKPQLAVGTIRSVQAFGYGRFSAEIQLPKGRNLWPAFWVVGEGAWPNHGEIDITEQWTNKRGGYFKIGKPQPPYIIPLTYWDTTTNIHWFDDYYQYWNYDGHRSVGSRRLPLLCSLKNPTNHFVKYEVEWKPDKITFFVNGHIIRSYGNDVAKWLNDTLQHVIIDLWTTGLDYTLETPMLIRNFKYTPLVTN